jgi:5-methylthioadenosine/S-adenosylhomocysteine deaminase
LAILEMIKSEITTFNEMYWFEEAQIQAVKEMGVRVVIGLVMLDFLPMGSKEKVEKLTKRLTTKRLFNFQLLRMQSTLFQKKI